MKSLTEILDKGIIAGRLTKFLFIEQLRALDMMFHPEQPGENWIMYNNRGSYFRVPDDLSVIEFITIPDEVFREAADTQQETQDSKQKSLFKRLLLWFVDRYRRLTRRMGMK